MADVTQNGQSPIPVLPRPPSPSADPGVSPNKDGMNGEDTSVPAGGEIDIYKMSAIAALKMLCGMIEDLICMTGDVPPTPPVSQHTVSNRDTMEKEKENVARQQEQASQGDKYSPSRASDHDDVPPRAKTPIGSPEARPTEPLHAGDPSLEPLNLQLGVIVRKFYSKKAPSISLEEYLMRVHQYCPMSTGVYLATSLYIHRLAIVERIIPVTARNAHRLVLAGLRVSMKKLEDYRYSHSRFAKVGGVSEAELGKLEVSFCFLTSFDLKADKEMLCAHAKAMGDRASLTRSIADFKPVLPSLHGTRAITLGPSRSIPLVPFKAPAAA